VASARFSALIEDSSAKVRARAASWYGDRQYQPRAPGTSSLAVPLRDREISALLAALRDPSLEVRMAASSTLAEIGLRDDRVIPALCQALRARRESGDLAGSLDRLSWNPPDNGRPTADARIAVAFRAILDLLKLENAEVRRAAIGPIVRIIAIGGNTQDPVWHQSASTAIQSVLS